MGKGIVLGRFQPFHNGHAYLVEQALARFEKVTIAVGSAQDEWTVDNPFSFEERKDMIQKWVNGNGNKEKVDIIAIEDINDPLNWVKHASNHHGKGTLVTSDDGTTFDSGLISNSQTFTLTGLSIGTYGYHSTPHPSMTGTIIVQ